MAHERLLSRYLSQDMDFYRLHYHHIFIGLLILLGTLLCIMFIILFQIINRPLPRFDAIQPDNALMNLTPYENPNLLPDTIIQWANKAAVTAYTFDFSNYNTQLEMIRPYFTDAGWKSYVQQVSSLIDTLLANKLFVNGIVSAPSVISNQGWLLGTGYTWRVQIPFLVTYQSGNTTSKRNYYVVLTIVRVPTYINPQGIGIDQFIMV